MEKKQSAVDWLEQRLFDRLGKFTKGDIDQAKQMEKEQIMDAWEVGLCTRSMHDICSEYYYNDTFKGGRG
jgi:hypothetical protein